MRQGCFKVAVPVVVSTVVPEMAVLILLPRVLIFGPIAEPMSQMASAASKTRAMVLTGKSFIAILLLNSAQGCCRVAVPVPVFMFVLEIAVLILLPRVLMFGPIAEPMSQIASAASKTRAIVLTGKSFIRHFPPKCTQGCCKVADPELVSIFVLEMAVPIFVPRVWTFGAMADPISQMARAASRTRAMVLTGKSFMTSPPPFTGTPNLS